MVYTLKFEGKKYAYDSAAGTTVTLPSLPFKMVEALEPPLEPLCPTSLRYELAKYDSRDVEEAYDSILEYAADGILYKEDDGVVRMIAEGEYACGNDRLATELLTKAFSAQGQEIRFEAVGADAEDLLAFAKKVATGLGKQIV